MYYPAPKIEVKCDYCKTNWESDSNGHCKGCGASKRSMVPVVLEIPTGKISNIYLR
jgi:hypothetical protein